jgi:hypothetical protein
MGSIDTEWYKLADTNGAHEGVIKMLMIFPTYKLNTKGGMKQTIDEMKKMLEEACVG